MALLTLEGFEVPVLPGTEVRDEPWGDYARAYSGRMRSDRRASHRTVRVVASLFDTADDAVALRTILNTPGQVLAGGTMIGDDAYFHVRNIQFAPQTVDRLSFTFELHETDDSPSPLLFSFDGDAPGTYTFTRSSSAWFTNAIGYRRQSAANVLRREYLWLDGTYAAATRPDTAAYLIEAARTNLVSSDNFDSGWTSSNGPVITASISDPAGGTGAYRIADDNAAAAAAKYLTVAFTGNATKVVVYVVREATMASSGNQALVLYDDTTAADRLRLIISAWTDGEPTVAASTGTYLGKRYVGNGYWAIYGLSTSVTAGNTNQAWIMPAETSAATGSIDVYRVNAYNATTSPWSILDAGEALTAGSLYAPFPYAPRALTVYLKFVEGGTVDISGGGLLSIGSTAAPRVVIGEASGFYGVTHANGSTSVSAALADAPAWGDTVEIRVTLSSAGVVQIGQSINGGTETVSSASSAAALAYAWDVERVYVGSLGGASQGMTPFISAKIVRGSQTMAYMRDVARGRLHPRTADTPWTFRARYSLSASVAASSTATATES